MKNAILFSAKYAVAVLALWFSMFMLTLVVNFISAIWEFVLVGLVILGVYLVFTGKYKPINEIFNSFISSFKNTADYN